MKMKYLIILIFLLNITQLFSQNNVDLSLNLIEGDEYFYSYKNVSSSFQEINGENKSVKKNIENIIKFTVLKPVSDTTFYLKLEFLKIRYVFDVDEDVIVIDTDSIEANSEEENTILLNVGKGYNFEINKKGQIIYANNITLRTNYKENKLLTLTDIQNSLKVFFPKLDKNKKLINEFWYTNDTIKGDILNVNNIKNTLTEISDSSYTISNFAKTNSDKNNPKIINNLHIYYNLEGKYVGETILNANTCMLTELNIIETGSGKSEIKYSKEGGVIFSSPIKIENIISVKLIKK